MSIPSIETERYCKTISRFATGVTVVASGWGDELHAMTANAVTSLSLEPLQLLVAVRNESRCAESIARQGVFSVNVLRADQRSLSTYFSGHWKGATPPPFGFVPWQGAPRLKGCIAAICCRVSRTLDGGDHRIIIGDVLASYSGPGNSPLLYFQGTYHNLA
jgi:flavin reductase (DIM6/NTAB) family NADH-FMN oxidoreductase RutF